MPRYEIIVPNWRPTLDNELIGCHRMKAAKLKKSTRDFVFCYGRLAGVSEARGRRRVTLILTYPNAGQLPDPTAPWKSLLDALVSCGYLIDDDAASYESETVLRTGPALETRIVIEDIPDPRGG